jgi:integrase
MEIHIRKRQTKRQGLAYDLDYRWNGKRYRPLLGYNLTPAESQQRAVAMLQTIQANAYSQATAAQQAPTLNDVLPLFWNSFTIKNRVDRARPENIIKKYLLPFFGIIPLHSIPLKYVELPEADKRTRVAEAEELELLRTIKEKDPSRRECRKELWRIIQVALNVGLREWKILTIDRSWIKKREDGYWLCLPPAASRIKGNPKEIPLNRIAMRALVEDLPSLTDGRVFRHWTNARSFKGYWLKTVRRVGLQNLRFHDLRHTFTTRLQRLGVDYELRQALLGHKMPGMTASYSHGGPEWDARLRDAVTRLEKGYGLVYERSACAVDEAKHAKTWEPVGTRPQEPRHRMAEPVPWASRARLASQPAPSLHLYVGGMGRGTSRTLVRNAG